MPLKGKQMAEQEKDRILWHWKPESWWLPWIAVVKSGVRKRWTIIFQWVTDETEDRYFVYWLQFRAWWPPVFFYRGWILEKEE